MGDDAASGAGQRRIWAFGRCVFDEARWVLEVAGAPVELEAKPLEILLELLRHAGEVVTKEELLDSVWPGLTVVEGSLTTAVSKLRKALGDDAAAAIVTAPRIGYRLGLPVSWRVAPASRTDFAFHPGDPVPERSNWRFDVRLGGQAGSESEVWRVRHAKTGEARVMKFAADPRRLRALKREVAIGRVLRQSFGERADFVPILDWNFSTAPFFIESADGGPDLPAWAAERGGLATLPLAERVALLAAVAHTLAAAHGVAVLHKDLKPANILIESAHGAPRPRIVDFGSGTLADPDRLTDLGITHSGFDMAGAEARDPTSGTYLWMAPELLKGGAASVASDVFALGVMLYQLVVADLRRPLAPGWEAEVSDPLLRADIAAAAAGDPALRLDSAAELARRLGSLDARRAEHEARTEADARAARAELKLQQVKARRPWAIAAGVALTIGAATTTALYFSAAGARDTARRQTAIADQINTFLASDLLARSNPFRGAAASETLVGAVEQAAPLIDSRFPSEPEVAARLHQTIANALDRRSDWVAARAEYARALGRWTEARGANSADATAARLQAAAMEARSFEGGSRQRAEGMIRAAESAMAAMPRPRPDLPVWLASAKGMVALVTADMKTAEREFGVAADGAAGLPGFDAIQRLNFRQRLAFSKIRLGDGAGAERLFRDLARDYASIEGPDGPNVLMVNMNLAQALMIQGRHAEAVAQADRVYPLMVQRLGPDNELTLQVLTTRAQSEGVLERWNDAIRDDLVVHQLAVKKQGPKSFFAIASLSDAATAECRGGRIAAGLADAETAHEMAKAGFGKSALTDAAAYTAGACLIQARRYRDAAAHLEGIDRQSVAQLAGDPNWGANVDLALAQVASAIGDRAEAQRRLDASAGAFQLPGAEPYQARLWKAAYAAITPK